MIVVGGIGCCACCIGGLLTAPMSQVMRYEAYLALTRGDQFTEWWVGSGRFPFDATHVAAASPATAWGSAPISPSAAVAPAEPSAPPAVPPPPAPPPPHV
jgi:hypothetical protein